MAEQALTPAPPVSKKEFELIKRTVAKGATNEELHLFNYDCRRRGVSPLDGLIYFTKVNGKYTPITSIDFLRSQAASTGEYAGNTDAIFSDDEDGHPLSATVTVCRLVQGQRCDFTATARFSEYLPRAGSHMWEKMPRTMVAKCAEALALRKGFPQETSGLYTADEMEQAEPAYAPTTTTQPVLGSPVLGSPVLDEEPPLPEDPPDSMMFVEEAPVTRPMTQPARQGNGQDDRLISEKQAKRLFAITMQHGKDPKDISAYIEAAFGYTHSSQIQRCNYDQICGFAEAEGKEF